MFELDQILDLMEPLALQDSPGLYCSQIWHVRSICSSHRTVHGMSMHPLESHRMLWQRILLHRRTHCIVKMYVISSAMSEEWSTILTRAELREYCWQWQGRDTETKDSQVVARY